MSAQEPGGERGGGADSSNKRAPEEGQQEDVHKRARTAEPTAAGAAVTAPAATMSTGAPGVGMHEHITAPCSHALTTLCV
jgi:hypothetical protein|eukprot:COSAG06_NODE_2055_length_7723_cov_6.116212_3_plen_80_part_00